MQGTLYGSGKNAWTKRSSKNVKVGSNLTHSRVLSNDHEIVQYTDSSSREVIIFFSNLLVHYRQIINVV